MKLTGGKFEIVCGCEGNNPDCELCGGAGYIEVANGETVTLEFDAAEKSAPIKLGDWPSAALEWDMSEAPAEERRKMLRIFGIGIEAVWDRLRALRSRKQ